jgi:hypothetical protein
MIVQEQSSRFIVIRTDQRHLDCCQDYALRGAWSHRLTPGNDLRRIEPSTASVPKASGLEA